MDAPDTQPVSTEQNGATPSSNSNTYKILLVDDDRFLLDMYAFKFKKNGHTIFSAGDGEEALKKIKEGLEVDAVLMDVIMPGMDGIGLLEEIRKDKLLPNAEIIMLTNQGQPQDIERAQALGISGYIIKATTIPSEVVAETMKILQKKQK